MKLGYERKCCLGASLFSKISCRQQQQQQQEQPAKIIMAPPPNISRSFSSTATSNRDTQRRSNHFFSLFRGFSTSISHSFVNYYDHDKTDSCSLACCGLLQAQRNKFLLTNDAPRPSAFDFTFYVVLPLFLFAAGLNLVFDYKHTERELYAGFGLLGVVALYFCVLMIRKCREQILLRREVLKQTYAWHINSIHGSPETCEFEDENLYLMGQTRRDLNCAHAPCGCYASDISYLEMEAPPPRDLCGCLWQSSASACCDHCCNVYVQCCGISGVAQESRELDRLYQPHHRAFDYVTMQPVLEYYSYILALRVEKKERIFAQFLAMSKLSRKILQSFVIIGTAIALFLLLFDVWLGHFVMYLLIFVATIVFVTLIHRRFAPLVLSIDTVIKGYGSGFYLAGTLALPFLIATYFFFEIIMYAGVELSQQGSDNYWYGYSLRGRTGSPFFTPFKSHWAFLMNKYHPILYFAIAFIQCFVVAFIEELAKYLAFRMIADHPDFWTKADLEKMVEQTGFNDESNEEVASFPPINVESHVRALRSRCVAFVVATMSVSLGFASFENAMIATVFFAYDFSFWDLMARILFLSISPVCATLQAVGTCRNALESKKQVKTGSIILPAVIVHGFFDAAVLAGDYVAESHFREGYLKLASRTIFPFVVFAISFCWAAVAFAYQKLRLDQKDPKGVDVRNSWTWNRKIPKADGSTRTLQTTSTLSDTGKHLEEIRAPPVVDAVGQHIVEPTPPSTTVNDANKSAQVPSIPQEIARGRLTQASTARGSSSSSVPKASGNKDSSSGFFNFLQRMFGDEVFSPVEDESSSRYYESRTLNPRNGDGLRKSTSDFGRFRYNRADAIPSTTSASAAAIASYREFQGNDDSSQGSAQSKERWIHLSKSLDQIMSDIRAQKNAVVYHPGTWDRQENVEFPRPPSLYTPPPVGHASPDSHSFV